MLRISELDPANGRVVLKIEGRIVGPWISELEKAAERLLAQGQPVRLDLADVTYVDREGVALLLNLKRRQVLLEGCSPFVTEELREAERGADTEKDDRHARNTIR
jgi:ABC-type transporter Mla MlaB component